MSTGFGILIIAMAIAAIGFVATPLFRHERRVGSASVAAVLPLFAIGLYLFVGSPQAADFASPTHAALRTTTNVSSSNRKSVGSVSSMVDGLARRLENNPDDGSSWLLLARSYKHLQRMSEAQDAYQHAVALGEYDEELASMVSPATATPVAGVQISGHVELSPDSAELALPTDTVFVFARAVGGPSMPVAVLRRPVSELPFDFRLNDSHSMSAAAKLSDYERVVVTARITRAGDARNALQGLEATSRQISVADHNPANLTIGQQEKE